MGLTKCQDCAREISPSARSCPHCGRPNEEVEKAERNNRRGNTQGAGCLVILLSLGLALVSPSLAGVAFLFGFVVLLIGLFLR